MKNFTGDKKLSGYFLHLTLNFNMISKCLGRQVNVYQMLHDPGSARGAVLEEQSDHKLLFAVLGSK